jgi:hypothetical protein
MRKIYQEVELPAITIAGLADLLFRMKEFIPRGWQYRHPSPENKGGVETC